MWVCGWQNHFYSHEGSEVWTCFWKHTVKCIIIYIWHWRFFLFWSSTCIKQITGQTEGAESEVDAEALDKHLLFPVASACVWIMKGRYTTLQSVPINSPSSGHHTGGPPHKESPYGVKPRHFQVLHPGPSPCAQLLNWQVLKQPQRYRQAQRDGEGGWTCHHSAPSQAMDPSLFTFLTVRVSIYSACFSNEELLTLGKPTTGRGELLWSCWDNSNHPGYRHPCLPHTNCWHLNSFDTYFKGCRAWQLY